MKNINILDCTLRDGGYCNEWNFGYNNIKKIINNLNSSGIDIIECGFLTNVVKYQKDVSRFNSVDELNGIIPSEKNRSMYVCMINYGEYNIEDIPLCDGNCLDGIRVAFHKKDMEGALNFCHEIRNKGYKVFVQPMVSLGYTDEEFLYLIKRSNQLAPYAFYIVDSFGVMKKKDLIRLFYLVDHNLDANIMVGYHSHNNMQLAYSNAQAIVDSKTQRNLIVDSSVFGMGRGAGNLNTELFVEYLNDNVGTCYKLKPLFVIIDEVLNNFYQQNYWGYSLPNYLSASHNTHPNYAGYLCDKNTLNFEDMNEIFSMMDDEKRNNFDKKYIENLYLRYLSAGNSKEENLDEFITNINTKKVVLIAPGKSSYDEKEKIIDFVSNNEVITISINFDYEFLDVDYIFNSNIRRFRALDDSKKEKCIVTSNIPSDDIYIRTNYRELLNECEMVRDNAGMMIIKLLIKYGVKEILLAGFDGYSHDLNMNYGSSQMQIVTQKDVVDAMNSGMTSVLREYANKVSIEFLTAPKYLKI